MKASEIKPQSWAFGTNNLKQTVLLNRWKNITTNAQRMEDTLLQLMANPETTSEQLFMASTLYADVTKKLHEHAQIIDNYIYHGTKVDDQE
jgi:hypothetical protein